MVVPSKRTLVDTLRRTERLFRSTRLKVPPIASEQNSGQLTYFDRTKQQFVIDSFFHKEPDDMQCYLLGRALAEYVYDKVNPHILQRIGPEAIQKYSDASQLPLRELGQSLLNLEYSPLHKVYRLVPAYAGMLLTREFHEKLNAQITKFEREIPVNMVVDMEMAAFMANCDEKRYKAFTAAGASKPTESLVSITFEAVQWYLRGGAWLPRLARLTTADEFRALAKEAGIKSEIVEPVTVDVPQPGAFYNPPRFLP